MQGNAVGGVSGAVGEEAHRFQHGNKVEDLWRADDLEQELC